MIAVTLLIDNLKKYIISLLDIMSKNTPIVGIAKPIITRIIDKNLYKVTDTLKLLTDSEGNIDAENILEEIILNIINSNPFIVNTSFIGNIEIGEGLLKLDLPFTDKKLVLNISDLLTFKEVLTNKE